MKIMFVAPRFHTNQVQHVEALQKAGHSVSFLVGHVGAIEDHALVKPTLVPWSRPFARFSELVTGRREARSTYLYRGLPQLGILWRELASQRPDLIVIRNPHHLFGTTAAVVARILRIPILLYTLGPKYRANRPAVRNRLGKALFSWIFGAVWMTPVKGDERAAREPDSRTLYVPLVARVVRYQNSWPGPAEPVRLMAVGKMQPRKHHLMLVDAFSPLAERLNLTLTIVGQCTTSEHKEYCQRLRNAVDTSGVRDRIRIQTNVPHKSMQKLYLEHHVFVFPSEHEPAGVSLLEAMGHGLAVMASSDVGIRWYIEPGRNGLVFKAGDRQSLRDAIADVVRDRDRLAAMGTASLDLVRQRHTGEAYVRVLELVAKGRQPRHIEQDAIRSPEHHSATLSALGQGIIAEPKRLRAHPPLTGTGSRAR